MRPPSHTHTHTRKLRLSNDFSAMYPFNTLGLLPTTPATGQPAQGSRSARET
jgi:hypothetical protein